MSYQKTILDNRIIILSEKVDYVRSIAIGVWINTGSRDETIENRGVAHFLEHMLFKGTSKRNKYEIAHFLESLGGAVNAFTSKEFTCFYARILSEHLEQSIDLLSDIIQNSILNNNEIEKEKSVVIDEISEVGENPGELIFERFYENLFPYNSLGYPIIGYKNDITKIDKNICTDFISKYYNSNRIIITASGFLEHNELVKFAKQYFKNISTQNIKREFTTIPNIKQKKQIFNEGTNHQTHVITGIRTFPYTNKNRFTLLVLNSILSVGMSSRLFQNIREKYGIAYDIHSFTDFYHDTGCFGIYAATNPENSKKCLQLIQSEIHSFIKEPVSESELKTIKAQLKSSLVMGFESTTARMNRLAKQYIYTKKVESIDKVIRKIENITPENIQNLARQLLKPESFLTTILQN